MSEASVKQRIDLDNGDIYGRHNAVETILVQWGLSGLAVGLAWLTIRVVGSDLDRTLATVALGVMALNAATATFLALISYRRRIPMEFTDWWDGVSALVLGVAVATLATATGGFVSPVWLVLIPVAVYAGSVFVYLRGYIAAAVLIVVIVLAGVLSGEWTREHLAYGVALVAVTTVCFMLTKEMGRLLYDLLWETGQHQVELDKALTELRAALDRTAQGDLTVRVAPERTELEQVAPLRDGLDETVASLRRLVDQIRGSGDEITTAAADMVSAAEQQAASAAQQNGTVSETTATIEELAATAAQISETAQSVARVAQETLSLTDEGRGAVAEAVSAMESITSTVDEIAVSSAGLGDKIVEVGRILVMIDELSEQTNLLALNAAIEAARAGEHGRGFAVVAAEVRKLAERAQLSTGQIQGIVTEIQAHARATVVASEVGAREAGRGAAKAAGAVVALDRIAAMVDEATSAAAEISIATQQQRSASDQVVVAMTQVSEVSRQYAAGSKQTQSASTEIAALAAAMQDSISTFKVERHEVEAELGPRAGDPADDEFVATESHAPDQHEWAADQVKADLPVS
jgi:methyl-accepting chemotaxis protein